jgi:aminobenzoyl-glutamate utilization protein B
MSIRIALLVSFCAALALAQPPPADQLRQEAQERVQSRAKLVQEITDSLFSFAELGYQEHETVRYLSGILSEKGFKIRTGVAGMPTAFVAEWGSGKPIIGLMADIDGLPETSQKPGVARHDPLIPGGPGHGEGHNAGQALQVAAALAVQEILQKHNLPGTIRIYPGRRRGAARQPHLHGARGLFVDLDAHAELPRVSSISTPLGQPRLALVSTQFSPSTASARTAPARRGEAARALDAVELMNIGWNFRREHLRLQQRSHYVISHGGNQPNVVPSEATVWYFFRETDYPHVKELHALGQQMARAAAMMTDTEMSERIIGAAWPGHFNKPLAELLHQNIERVGMPAVGRQADQSLARAVQKLMEAEAERSEDESGATLGPGRATPSAGSDDIAEVSWNVPTDQSSVPGEYSGHGRPPLVLGHRHGHADRAQGDSGWGAGAGDDADRAVRRSDSGLERAREYFAEQTKDIQWQSLIPADVAPPAHFNAEKMERVAPELEKLRYDPSRYATYMEQLGIEYPTIP